MLKIILRATTVVVVALVCLNAFANSDRSSFSVTAKVVAKAHPSIPRTVDNIACTDIEEGKLCWYELPQDPAMRCHSDNTLRWLNDGKASIYLAEYCYGDIVVR